MPRTPLLSRVAALAGDAASDHAAERGLTRRDVVRGAGALGAATARAGAWAPRASPATAPRIVVVGAGLAGLTAAHRLRQAGHVAAVHEASGRVGGRCWTLRGAFAEGQIAERGGELIDQGHTHIRQLVQELGLSLDNLLAAQPNGTEDVLFFDGAPYPVADATRDLKGIWQQVHADLSAASYPTLYTQSTARGRELDATSISDWIAQYVPGGRASRLGQLLEVAYAIEYGAEASDQSVLNLLYLLGYSGQGQMRLFGPSNEKYHVAGGNDQIGDRLAAGLPGQITLGSQLVAITRRADGAHDLALRQGGRTRVVTADLVVLTVPFSVLRASVDLSRSGFPALKRTAIAELGMSANAKVHLQFTGRHWHRLGGNGNTYADTGHQATWDVTRAQPGRSGILVNYTGGDVARAQAGATADALARRFLGQVEPVLPGLGATWTGRASADVWSEHPWTRGAYAYWKVGQYTRFAGVEREPSGTCHFAGEHTSVDFQGYLNGAVETGERAAGELLARLRR